MSALTSLVLAVALAAPAKKPPPKKEPAKKETPKKEAAAPDKTDKVAAKRTEKAAPEPKPETTREVVKRESKIEFDERVVQGQRAQGAVYLFQRAESPFSSLVKSPDSFRSRTIDSVYGDARRTP